MKKFKFKINIDWKSKLVDLIIVIVGITIAFQLNTWNESQKIEAVVNDYIFSFNEENKVNRSNLDSVLAFSISNRKDIDSLKQILLSKDIKNDKIKVFTASMMGLPDFNPSLTTMENITASGEFGLLEDSELRKRVIDTYSSFNATIKLQELLSDYVDTYITPYFFNNVRFSDFSSINSDFSRDPLYENIVFGYEVLLNQLIMGYENNLEKVELLNERLAITNSNK